MNITDGAAWTDDMNARISETLLAAFSSPAGVEALAYLVKITRGRVLLPTATDAELRDLEGRRALVAIIDMRMNDARSRRASAEPQPVQPGSGPGADPARRAARPGVLDRTRRRSKPAG
jgi:hypothetical protein